MRILLIDDEPDVLLHMKKALYRLGHSCETFEDPVLALSHFRREHYDVVISDVMMPTMNGFALAAQICRTAPGMEIILVSGNLTQAMEDRTNEYNSVICLNKPIDVHTLKLVLDKMDRQLQTG